MQPFSNLFTPLVLLSSMVLQAAAVLAPLENGMDVEKPAAAAAVARDDKKQH